MSVISGNVPRVMLMIFVPMLFLSACGGSGGGSSSASSTTASSHTVNLSWEANRESAVNTTGGGYIVTINGQTPINVPYVSGSLAPITTSTTLMSGDYSVTVKAYSALNPPGGSAGSTSAASSAFTFSVP